MNPPQYLPSPTPPEPYTLYVDESGDSNLAVTNPEFPLFVLCGVLVSNAEYQHLRQALNELKVTFCGSKAVILHSRDIRQQAGSFAWLQVPQRRQLFYEAINTVVQTQSYQALAVAVRKPDYLAQSDALPGDAYALALSALLERAISHLAQLAGPPPLHLVLERRGRREDQALARSFQQVLLAGTSQLSALQLAAFAPKITFRPKADNLNGHQFADLLAYPIARHVLAPATPNPAFEVLRPRLTLHIIPPG